MRIEKEELFAKMKKAQVVVLNVLSKADFNKLHIRGSENHPLISDHDVFSKEVVEKFGKDKPFIVYGDHFGLLESYQAAKALEDHGLKALNYSGGLREWYHSGLPVAGSQAGEAWEGK